MEGHLLKPTDIPLIITSTNSSPEITRRNLQPETSELRKNSINLECYNLSDRKLSGGCKSRNIGGSLKIDFGRNNSATNLINLPAKWSSVRIKGTGFDDSRKSIVKIEPCNGLPNFGLATEYDNLLSPSQANLKPHLGNVSSANFAKTNAFRFVLLFFFLAI